MTRSLIFGPLYASTIVGDNMSTIQDSTSYLRKYVADHIADANSADIEEKEEFFAIASDREQKANFIMNKVIKLNMNTFGKYTTPNSLRTHPEQSSFKVFILKEDVKKKVDRLLASERQTEEDILNYLQCEWPDMIKVKFEKIGEVLTPQQSLKIRKEINLHNEEKIYIEPSQALAEKPRSFAIELSKEEYKILKDLAFKYLAHPRPSGNTYSSHAPTNIEVTLPSYRIKSALLRIKSNLSKK